MSENENNKTVLEETTETIVEVETEAKKYKN